jgi:hypothetical protein
MRGEVVPLARGEPEEDTGLRWRALADPTRRRILDLLRQRPLITGEIAAWFPISRIAVMRRPPAAVFAALTKDAGGWWGHPFVTARATSLAMDPQLGGLFTERWENGGRTCGAASAPVWFTLSHVVVGQKAA